MNLAKGGWLVLPHVKDECPIMMVPLAPLLLAALPITSEALDGALTA